MPLIDSQYFRNRFHLQLAILGEAHLESTAGHSIHTYTRRRSLSALLNPFQLLHQYSLSNRHNSVLNLLSLPQSSAYILHLITQDIPRSHGRRKAKGSKDHRRERRRRVLKVVLSILSG